MAHAVMAISVFIPGAFGRRLSQLQRRLEPEGSGAPPPHIPLAGPFEVEPSFLPLEQHVWQVCHRAAPFQVDLGAPAVDAEQRSVFCAVVSGGERLAGLRAALLEGKYAPPRDEAPYVPRALIARLDPNDIAFAEREAAATEAGGAFLVERVELMAQYPDGTWYERDFYTLDATVAKT